MTLRLVVAAVLSAGFAFAADAIFFERHFPGAVPERFEVRLARDGSATYAEEGEEAQVLSLGQQEVAPLFERAAALDYFGKPLASKRRVASTGAKVLRFESGGRVKGEARFDYSESRDARDLASWFIKLAETQRHMRELERVVRYDRLGVNKAIVNLQQAFERDRIVVPSLLVPILSAIVEQRRIVHVARARAEALLERIGARP